MNIFETYRQHVIYAVGSLVERGALPDGLKLEAITLEPPREAAHGDLSTNAAMVISGQKPETRSQKAETITSPREIAELLAIELRKVPDVEMVEVAGPGFINIRLAASAWQSIIPVILAEGNSFGNSRMGAGKKVNVEYVSANPTGPMHVGHARGAVVGDALATLLLKAGYSVTKEYYINDAGAQVDKVARSAYLRYREACGEEIGEIPEGLYPGEYMKAAGEAIAEKYGRDLLEAPSLRAERSNPANKESSGVDSPRWIASEALEPPRNDGANGNDESHWMPIVRPMALDCMMALIKQDLVDLGIHHDVFTSEAALQKARKIEEAIRVLNDHGLIYRGILEPPKGKTPDDWEAREQTLFRATSHGDDVDRPVQKSDGSYTYFAGDLALAQDKIRRGFNHQILVLGADHGGYVKRLKAAVSALSDGAADCHVILCQLVHLFQNGEPFKMSKRAGTFITVRDVLDEVGKDILRFVMLMRKSDQGMDFDLAKVKEQSKDNPVFYVQYAHARAKSVLRLGAEQLAPIPRSRGIESAPSADSRGWPEGKVTTPPNLQGQIRPPASGGLPELNISLLSHPAELTLIKLLAAWPRQVEQAAIAHEPHRVIYYLQEVAAAFHGLWNVGSKDAEIRFILPDQPALTAARLALARATAIVVASALHVCGVEPVEELR